MKYNYLLLVKFQSTMVNNVSIAASWSELGVVHIWDLSRMLGAVNDNSQQQVMEEVPIFSFKGHRTEGFAVDWAPIMPGEPGNLHSLEINKYDVNVDVVNIGNDL